MIKLSLAFVLLLVASALRPAPPPTNSAMLLAGVFRAAALGREFAAADFAWLGLVQSLGSAEEERKGNPTLVHRVDVVTQLDAHFTLAYHLGAIALVNDPKRSGAMVKILERGRQASPRDPDLPRLLGFLEHFGRMDLERASAYYRESTKLGGPSFLTALASRLENSSLDCRLLATQLAEMRDKAGTREEAQMLARQLKPLMLSCEKVRLKAAAAAFRLNVEHQREPRDLQELLDSGVDPPGRLPGFCWQLVSGTPELVECDERN